MQEYPQKLLPSTLHVIVCLQADLFTKLEDPQLNIALENHEYGLPPPFYQRWPVLDQWFNILTTTKDRNGTEYISTIEAKNYPFTGGCCLQQHATALRHCNHVIDWVMNIILQI